MWAPISMLRVRQEDHAGRMNLFHIQELVRGSLLDPRPIEVTQASDGTLLVKNGRHRFVAALILGVDWVEVDVID